MKPETACKTGIKNCKLDLELGFEVGPSKGALGPPAWPEGLWERDTPRRHELPAESEAAVGLTDWRATFPTGGFSQYWLEP